MKAKIRIRFALVGYGHIGKRHAAVIAKNPECELVAIADSRTKEEVGFADQTIAYFSSLETLLKSGIDFDVLTIATPNGLHEKHALMALKSGHHVIIEKPMALTKAACESIIQESRRCQKHVFCVMQNRYSSPSVWLKEILANKLLGEIYIVQFNCYWNRDQRYYTPGNWHGTRVLDGGTLFTQFSHFIDILYWLFGDITNINAVFKNFNHQELIEFEDTGFVTFDFKEGGSGIFNYSTSVWNTNLESSITVIGQRGTVRVGGQYMNEVQICNIEDYKMPALPDTNPPNDYGPYKGSAANHHFVYENVLGVLKGHETIKTNAADGLKVVEIIERIYQSNSHHSSV